MKIAKVIARNLLDEHASGASWRKISRRVGGLVKPGTLCRIAKSDGEYFPDFLKVKEYRKITQLTTRELLWVLENRG
ncbi:MAG: hypothetical protein WC714_28850 [Candidatus Obscuribacterales bacterium]|jgi:hypothetical protein